MKIVMDANIFISSFYWRGNPRKVFYRVTEGLDELYITDEILTEIFTVMSREKFNTNRAEIETYINIIKSYSIEVFPKTKPEEVSRDKDDNKILQCGLAVGADFIITGDKDLLVLNECGGVKIVSPKEYLEIIAE
jgi:putative PIN family toxin of toxin-antitoxin system